MTSKPSKKPDNSLASPSLAIGIGLGVVFGVALDNVAIGISLGLVFGVSFSTLQNAKKSEKGNSPESDDGSGSKG